MMHTGALCAAEGGLCTAGWWHISYRQGTLALDASHLRWHFISCLTAMLLLFVDIENGYKICAWLPNNSLLTGNT